VLQLKLYKSYLVTMVW